MIKLKIKNHQLINKFKEECKNNNLITIMDLLEYYNKIDVKPFLTSIIKSKRIIL